MIPSSQHKPLEIAMVGGASQENGVLTFQYFYTGMALPFLLDSAMESQIIMHNITGEYAWLKGTEASQ